MTRIGIIGTGWGARVQVPTFRESGLDVVAIAGFHRNRTRELAGELGLQPFDDWRELVASDVDLVSIVTPPAEHRAMTVASLDAGKHLICEKPTALNALEAEHMLTAAKRHPERIAIIDHELRFLPAWRAARERIGELGPVRYAEVRYSSPSRGSRMREWNWWSDASRGGGVFGAVGSHYCDALRYFGMEFLEAQATMQSLIAERPFGAGTRTVTSDDWTSVHFRLAGGAMAAMTFSVVASGPDEPSVMTIYCEKGAMRFVGERVLLSQEGSPFTVLAGEELAGRPGNSPGGAFGTGTLHLGRALHEALDLGRREALAPAATFEDGVMQQRILDAARRSATSGGWEKI